CQDTDGECAYLQIIGNTTAHAGNACPGGVAVHLLAVVDAAKVACHPGAREEVAALFLPVLQPPPGQWISNHQCRPCQAGQYVDQSYQECGHFQVVCHSSTNAGPAPVGSVQAQGIRALVHSVPSSPELRRPEWLP